MSPLYLAVTVRFCVSRMAFGSIYNIYVTGWTRLLRSILAMLRLLVFLVNLYIISMSLLYFRWIVDGASPQFLDRVVDISVMLRDKYAQCYIVLFSGY